MLYEPTTLANFARVIGETLEKDYGVDPPPLFAEANIDAGKFARPGARISFSKIDALWSLAIEATGDRWLGFAVGARIEPGDFFVLGHAWLASATLLDGMQRLVRYGKVLSPALVTTKLCEDNGLIASIKEIPDPTLPINRIGEEAGFVAFSRLCELVMRRPVRPVSVELVFPKDESSSRYDELFQCPIAYGSEREVFCYSAEELNEPLPGYIPEVLDATTEITRAYISSFDQSAVTTEVRRLLTRMLPAGTVDQDSVAFRLHRSRRTLQRQLTAEGTNYRDILDGTRKSLAERYLRDGNYSQAEIAYMIGLSDQRSFARAFRRWTGMSPGRYRKEA